MWTAYFIIALCSSIPCLWKIRKGEMEKTKEQTQSSSGGVGKWMKKLLVLFVLLGVVVSIWLYWYLNDGIQIRKETLANMCDERARMLQDQFNVSMNHVHALAILVSTFYHGKEPPAIDQKTFGEYTERTSFERPLTSSVAYALRVRHFEREKFEKEHGWTIKRWKLKTKTRLWLKIVTLRILILRQSIQSHLSFSLNRGLLYHGQQYWHRLVCLQLLSYLVISSTLL